MTQALPVVLLVDDSELYRSMLRVYLKDLPLTVLEAADGDEALLVVDRHSVTLVVADLNMERVGGLDLLRELRRHSSEVVRRARFVLMTAEEQSTEHVAHAKGAAIDAFVTKPVRPRAFRELVEKLIAS